MRSRWGFLLRTVYPAVVAQTLSPAMLMMAPLSTWPVPTRLSKQLAHRVLETGGACIAVIVTWCLRMLWDS